ncbi:hypothetical protein G0Q06_12860 [Puniceicoccales bacterium CK1056]|uniref:Uncharacterized protein n=1 Tax=Oceanipulchritudo coccoides TaxID=2706888 RepID=A0A6B2M309_9BACT|nr:hypothetical protein [Oceanipulchritudo coccoides]NDV63348.1 hypothetical protein [Oceanipulchritudo coccoides]
MSITNQNATKQLEVTRATDGIAEVYDINPGTRPVDIIEKMNLPPSWELVANDGHSQYKDTDDLYQLLPGTYEKAYAATPTRVGRLK